MFIILEIVIEILWLLLIELGIISAPNVLRPGKQRGKTAGYISIIFLALITGFIFCLIIPVRIFPDAPLTGLSLLIAPVISGYLMMLYGRWREERGKRKTILTSFSGGALFAFVFSLVRFLLYYFEIFR